MREMIDFLNRLAEIKWPYTIKHPSKESLSILVEIPGEIWEVEFLANGEVEVEKFKSDGTLFPKEELNVIFEKFSE